MRVKVFIQNEAGSNVKNYHDEKTLTWERSVEVSRPYPYPYGFIVGTTSPDGWNVDCFVLTRRRLRTGDIFLCEPLGLMEQIEDGEEDHNVLGRLEGEDATVTSAAKAELTEFVQHVFDHVEGKAIRVGRFQGRGRAEAHITAHAEDGDSREGAATPDMVNEACRRCGASFHCGGRAGISSCWCTELPHVMPVVDAGCLCPSCLERKIKTR